MIIYSFVFTALRSHRQTVSSFPVRHPVARRGEFQYRQGQKLFQTISENIFNEFAMSLRDAHENGGTDEVMKITAPGGDYKAIFDQLSTEGVIKVAVKASSNESGRVNTGVCASIINALVALSHDDVERCIEFLDLLTDASSAPIQPDLVTLSCIISSILQNKEESNYYRQEAKRALDICLKMSKKKAGGARRKELAAARRKQKHGSSSNADILKEKFGIDILYEDDNFIGVSKPAGMLCYAIKSKKRQRDVTLEDALSSVGSIPLSTINPEARGIVHRLDRGASGALIVAKNDYSHACLVAEFFRRSVKKSYFALSAGIIDPPSGSIDMFVDNKPALSHYVTIAAYDCNASLIKVQTETGRKHQVRSHLAQMGAPIFLDPLFYSEENIQSDLNASEAVKNVDAWCLGQNKESPHSYKFFLHCSSLVIPRFGIDLNCVIPEWWSETIDNLSLDQSFGDNLGTRYEPTVVIDTTDSYEAMTVAELKTRCKELKIAGYSGKKKDEIIQLILAHAM